MFFRKLILLSLIGISHVHAHLQVDVYLSSEHAKPVLVKKLSITSDAVRIDRFDQPQYVLYKLKERALYAIHATARHYSKVQMDFEDTAASKPQKSDFETRVDAVKTAKIEQMLNDLLMQKEQMTSIQYQAALDAISHLQLEFFGADYISNEMTYIKGALTQVDDIACQHVDVVKSGHQIGTMCVSGIKALGVSDSEYAIFTQFIGFMREIDQSVIVHYLMNDGKGVLPILLQNDINKERISVVITRITGNDALFEVPPHYKMLQ